MSFRDGESSDIASDNMEQEEKIKIEETSINLGYVKKELENEELEFQEYQYNIASNFDDRFQESSELKNNGDSFKEEDKELKQETIERSQLEINQCHSCNVRLEKWEHLENHMLHCFDQKYNRLSDSKLDIQRKPAEEIEVTQGNGDTSTAIDDNKSSLTLTETRDPKCVGGISKACKERSFDEKKHKCSECSYQTNHKSSLTQHLNIHNNIKAFQCDICKKRFTVKGNLKTHVMNVHSNTEKKYKCTECSYQTNVKDKFCKHITKHVKLSECDICKKKFTEKVNLNKHIRQQHANTIEMKYKCSKCSYQTDDKSNLNRHLNTHYYSKPFGCDICKMRFTQKYSLKKHIKNIHSNIYENKYKCTECSYQTNFKEKLNKHINIHLKPFECDTCKKKFTQKNNLKKHIEDKHSNTDEKKYRCTECPYQTNYNANFKLHLNRHYNIKPFECDICEKRFATKGSLKMHIKDIHSDINGKYKCSECSYQTDCKSNLKSHLNTH